MRLTIGFSAMIVFMAVIGAAGYRGLSHMGGALDEAFQVRMPALDLLLNVDRDLQQLIVAERSMIFANAKSEIFQSLLEDYEENLKQSTDRFAMFEALPATAEAKSLIAGYKKAREEWLDISRQIVEGRKADTRQGRRLALDLSLGQAGEKFEAARDFIDKLTELNENLGKQTAAASRKQYNDTSLLLALVLGIGIVAAVCLAVIITRSVAGPVKTATKVMNAVSKGDLSQRLNLGKRKDEIGILSAAIDKMADNLNSVMAVLGEVAKGDLTVRISKLGPKDQITPVIKMIVDSLLSLVEKSTQASQKVAIASNQVSDSSQGPFPGSHRTSRFTGRDHRIHNRDRQPNTNQLGKRQRSQPAGGNFKKCGSKGPIGNGKHGGGHGGHHRLQPGDRENYQGDR